MIFKIPVYQLMTHFKQANGWSWGYKHYVITEHSI
jgi:hypothetical protein